MFFANSFFGGTLMQIEGDYEDELKGEDAPLLKFIVAPALSILAIILSLKFLSKKASIVVCFSFSLLFVVAGARSQGLILLITTLLSFTTYFPNFQRRIGLLTIFLLLMGYTGYTIYVHNVLNGNIQGGNNTQVTSIENPYNPASLLMYGRSEVYVEVIATANSLLYGYSTRPLDITGEYNSLRYKIKTGYNLPKTNSKDRTIPRHSIIFDQGLNYGIIALLIILFLTLQIIRRGMFNIFKDKKYTILIAYSLGYIIWNSLFSPTGNLKWNMPIYYAIILFIYDKYYNPNRRFLKSSK